MNRRYKPSENETAKSVPVLASFLDRRYKRLTFLSSDQKKITEKEIESRMDEIPLTCMKNINTCQKTNVCEDPEPSPKRVQRPSGIEFLTAVSPEGAKILATRS